MTTITQVLISFLLLTVGGAAIAHGLQHKNWVRQQRLSAQERLIDELKSLFVELDSLLSRRLFRTRRLVYALRSGDTEKIQNALRFYDNIVCDWNEKRNSFQIRLVRVVSSELAGQFDGTIGQKFVNIGATLEEIARAQSILPAHRATLLTVEHELNKLSRSIFVFGRDIYKALQDAQKDLFSVEESLPTRASDVDEVSTWYLIKTLFIPPRSLTK